MTTNGFNVKEIFPTTEQESTYGGSLSLFNYIAGAGETIPPWWSQARDTALKQLAKNSDHLSGTISTIVEMIMTIPHQVLPRNARIKSHLRQARLYQDIIDRKSESRSAKVKTGFTSCFAPFIQDIISTDNGGFIAIEGPGNDALIGTPTKLIHLDSIRCMRTNSTEWPVIYTDRSGQRYKIHRTRLINLTQQPDSSADMLGVGFCSVSRCINAVQNLIDMSHYKQEKLGSRPRRGIIHVEDGGQREVKALDNLLQKHDYMQSAMGYTRYATIPIFGSKGTVNLIDLASLPDGFDELTSTQLDMAVLALAFGVDSRQLAFALGVSGVTKADAEVQHEKMRGKGPGFLMQEIERLLDEFFLPDYLQFKFDYQDDGQDKAQAETRQIRSNTRKTNLESGVTDTKVERENMVRDGDLTQEQFEALEAEAVEPEPEEMIEVEEKQKDYASTQFNMPVWVTRLCAGIASSIDQDDIEEIEHDSHITLKYGITHNDSVAIANAVKDFNDLSLTFGNLSLFENDNDVLKIDIELTDELRRLHDAVANTGSDDLYNGEYNPHLTIAYLKKGTGSKYTGSSPLSGKNITIDTVTFSTTDRTIVNIPLGQRVKSLSSFTASINANARALYNQDFDISDFIAAMNSSIERSYNQAWIEGARECNIEPSERTEAETSALNAQIASAKTYVFGLGEYIEDNRESPFSFFADRLSLWTNRYEEVRNQAMVMACADQKLEWKLGARLKHCATCSRLAGRVMRASRWAELDVYPRDTRPGKLECNGFKCGCSLTKTDKRATPGRLPSL